jgi:response regulator of the lytR/algR family
MRIAICDDQQFFVDKIKNRIESYLNDKNISFEIDTFTDGLTLISSYKYIHKYDIIFLDVEMPCFTGEDVAKEFKNDEHRPLIIFTTSHSDFAKRGYRYNVYDFLDKSDIDNELINILNNSIKDLTTKRKEELVEFNDISVKVKNIMYLVAAKKNTEIYITTDTIKIDRTPLKYFEEQEAFKDFIKINRNTIVNYDYILSIDDNKIKMNNGVIFDVPKIKTNEIKMKIMQIGINRHGIY